MFLSLIIKSSDNKLTSIIFIFDIDANQIVLLPIQDYVIIKKDYIKNYIKKDSDIKITCNLNVLFTSSI